MSTKFLKRLTQLKQQLTLVPRLASQARDNVVAQKLLMERYRDLGSGEFRSFRDVGWGIYSQHDEDGILHYLFSRISARTRRSVEVCAGNGIECNTANLLLNHRWTGLLVDGSEKNVASAKNFYQQRPETVHWPPDVVHAWLTRDNINKVVQDAGYTGEIDLLSLDVDGMDYWLWEALEVVEPRIVVLEYNHLLGPETSVTVPYDPNFVAEFTEYGSDYAGASLQAFMKLARNKG